MVWVGMLWRTAQGMELDMILMGKLSVVHLYALHLMQLVDTRDILML